MHQVSTVLYYREMDAIVAAEITSVGDFTALSFLRSSDQFAVELVSQAPPSVELRKRQFLWGNGWVGELFVVGRHMIIVAIRIYVLGN